VSPLELRAAMILWLRETPPEWLRHRGAGNLIRIKIAVCGR